MARLLQRSHPAATIGVGLIAGGAITNERYELIERAHAGAQGEVWRARDLRSGHTVALKRTPRSALPPDHRSSLIEAIPPHPNLATVRDVFVDGDDLIVVMAWIDGRTVRDQLRDEGGPGLPLERAVALLEPIAGALTHLHAHGVVHADVKPSNILVTPDGGTVLVDLGLAQHRDAPSTVAGTPGYAAPEMAGGGSATAAADVYGFAATLYALLYGEAPEPAIKSRWPGLGSQASRIERAMRRGLAIDPTRRPASPEAFLNLVRPPRRPNDRPTVRPLIGRDELVRTIDERLRRERAVCLVGPAGIGTSRLALAVAATFDATEGPWIADLRDADEPDALHRLVAEALGMAERGRSGRPDPIIDRLRFADGLLVLDNCPPAAGSVDGLLQMILEQTDVHVLGTSRAPLATCPSIPVPPLAAPPPEADPTAIRRYASVRLFIERAGPGRLDITTDTTTASQVGAACRALDGIPLAIELAATQLADRTLPQIVEELTGDAEVPALQAAIEGSVASLSERRRRVLLRASVFPGAFDLRAAEAVIADQAVSVASIFDELSALSEHALVMVETVADEPRYRLLPSVRAWAMSALGAEASPVNDRLLAWARARTTGARGMLRGEDARERANELQQDHAALVAALGWAEATGASDVLAQMCLDLAPLWQTRGPAGLGRRWIKRALRAFHGHPDVQVELLLASARLAIETGDLGAARDACARGLQVASGDDARASALIELGNVANLQGELTTARRHHEDALAMVRAAGDAFAEAGVLNDLGMNAGERGDLEAANGFLQQSLALRKRLADERGEATTLANLGITAALQGDFEAAERWFEDAIPVARRTKNIPHLVTMLVNLGEIARLRGDLDTARGRIDEAVAISRHAGLDRQLGLALGALGNLCFLAGDLEDALAHHREGIRLHLRGANAPTLAAALEAVATVEEARGNHEPAARALGAATRLREDLDLPIPEVERESFEDLRRRLIAAGPGAEAALADGARDPTRVARHLTGEGDPGR